MSAVVPMIPVPTLDQLIVRRVQLKREADKAAELVKSVDQQILALIPKKDEGSVTERAGDWKAIATYKMNRKVDVAKVRAEWAEIPESVQAVLKWDAEISVTALRLLSAEDTAIISKYFESKPASPGLKIEAV